MIERTGAPVTMICRDLYKPLVYKASNKFLHLCWICFLPSPILISITLFGIYLCHAHVFVCLHISSISSSVKNKPKKSTAFVMLLRDLGAREGLKSGSYRYQGHHKIRIYIGFSCGRRFFVQLCWRLTRRSHFAFTRVTLLLAATSTRLFQLIVNVDR